MTALDLDRLEQLATAATPGPWETGRQTDDGPFAMVDGGDDQIADCHRNHWGDRQCEANAAFIAALSPDVVLELIRWAKACQSAFGRYGVHQPRCRSEDKCTCGWEEAWRDVWRESF